MFGLPSQLSFNFSVLEMENVKGTIPADCRLPIRCTVRPARRAHYCWTISYHILNASGSVLKKESLQTAIPVCVLDNIETPCIL